MKGIILAAGKGTRLYPMTKPVCKPLLPVYDKPLIYYPIAILMQAGISDILIIVPPDETDTFAALLGDGSQFGLRISYAEQPVARGIADALLIGSDFVGDDQVCLVLGDNIFYAPTLGATLKRAVRRWEKRGWSGIRRSTWRSWSNFCSMPRLVSFMSKTSPSLPSGDQKETLNIFSIWKNHRIQSSEWKKAILIKLSTPPMRSWNKC